MKDKERDRDTICLWDKGEIHINVAKEKGKYVRENEYDYDENKENAQRIEEKVIDIW